MVNLGEHSKNRIVVGFLKTSPHIGSRAQEQPDTREMQCSERATQRVRILAERHIEEGPGVPEQVLAVIHGSLGSQCVG